MSVENLNTFLKAQNFKKKLLYIFCGLSLIFLNLLLFVKKLPLPFPRSWLIVALLLLFMFSVLGIMRLNKHIKYFTNVFDKAITQLVQFKITKEQEWQKELDYYAELSFSQQVWEVHLYPPTFKGDELVGKLWDLEVYFDEAKKPAILKTPWGFLFISSARACR
ncbi:MAG: hypothetical protein KDD40_04680 [Bdellovibrionales bacterium]|nr:hypothetical protein [Bdellovibrionales bacterium]